MELVPEVVCQNYAFFSIHGLWFLLGYPPCLTTPFTFVDTHSWAILWPFSIRKGIFDASVFFPCTLLPFHPGCHVWHLFRKLLANGVRGVSFVGCTPPLGTPFYVDSPRTRQGTPHGSTPCLGYLKYGNLLKWTFLVLSLLKMHLLCIFMPFWHIFTIWGDFCRFLGISPYFLGFGTHFWSLSRFIQHGFSRKTTAHPSENLGNRLGENLEVVDPTTRGPEPSPRQNDVGSPTFGAVPEILHPRAGRSASPSEPPVEFFGVGTPLLSDQNPLVDRRVGKSYAPLATPHGENGITVAWTHPEPPDTRMGRGFEMCCFLKCPHVVPWTRHGSRGFIVVNLVNYPEIGVGECKAFTLDFFCLILNMAGYLVLEIEEIETEFLEHGLQCDEGNLDATLRREFPENFRIEIGFTTIGELLLLGDVHQFMSLGAIPSTVGPGSWGPFKPICWIFKQWTHH